MKECPGKQTHGQEGPVEPVRGQDYRSALFDDAQDGVPESTTCLGVHACSWFILRTCKSRYSAAATQSYLRDSSLTLGALTFSNALLLLYYYYY